MELDAYSEPSLGDFIFQLDMQSFVDFDEDFAKLLQTNLEIIEITETNVSEFLDILQQPVLVVEIPESESLI